VEYKAALRLSPQYVAASINLADLYRGTGRDGEGEHVLRNAISIVPNDGALHHALGLALVRLKRSDAALAELRRAADLEPNNTRYAYVYGVALHSSGHGPEAIAYLREIQSRYPESRDILLAIINFSREAGDTTTALQYAAQLSRISPNDPAIMKLLEELQLAPLRPKQ
jgi:Tfp pilus assembly protein PilF